MSDTPVLKGREVVKILTNLGFEEVRQRGSHRLFKHPDGRRTVVADHAGRDISPIILGNIARDLGVTTDDLLEAR
jgi:predicted RNA binding protein YcfA (HicA-like mRNA interferase family)